MHLQEVPRRGGGKETKTDRLTDRLRQTYRQTRQTYRQTSDMTDIYRQTETDLQTDETGWGKWGGEKVAPAVDAF